MSKGTYIINKYGAIDVQHIIDLEKRVKRLENIVSDYCKVFALLYADLFGMDIYMTKDWMLESNRYTTTNDEIFQIFKNEYINNKSILRKLRKLTNADDYEWITETKLVKKGGKNGK